MPLSFEEQFWTTNAMTQFARLAALDRIWTDYLDHARRPIPEQDVRTLEWLSDAMSELLQEATDRAGYLDSVCSEHSEELEEEYERLLESDELTEGNKARLQETVERNGGILEYARSSANAILNEAPSQAEALAAKMDAIRSGRFAPGDLSATFLCNLAAGCIISGLFAPPPTNLIGVGTGLAIIIGVSARGEEC